jgi:hypothetical protein
MSGPSVQEEFRHMMELCDPEADTLAEPARLSANQMADRVAAVQKLLKVYEDAGRNDGAAGPFDNSVKTIEEKLQLTGGHAGRAFSRMVSFDTPGLDTAESIRGPVLPEYMMQKMEDLGTAAELGAREVAEIKEKFDVLDRDHNGMLDYDVRPHSTSNA